jgi:hypothetical protein
MRSLFKFWHQLSAFAAITPNPLRVRMHLFGFCEPRTKELLVEQALYVITVNAPVLADLDSN